MDEETDNRLRNEDWEKQQKQGLEATQSVEPQPARKPTPFEVRTHCPKATFELWHLPGRRWGNVPEW